jgi:hypothetical protein
VKPSVRVEGGFVRLNEPFRALDFGRALRSLLAVDVRVAAVLGAAIVVVLALPLAAGLNIWTDEAFTLHTTGAGPVFAWQQAVRFEAQPPLYFVLEAVWRLLDEASIVFARCSSIVFAAAAVAVIVGAAHRIVPRIAPLAVAVMAAFHPLVIWAAVEMRVYALVLLIGAALTWAFFCGFLIPQPSQRARLWYVFLAIAGLYTQYYVGFLLLAHGLTLLAANRQAVRNFVIAGAVITLGFAPFLGVAVMHTRSSGSFVLTVSVLQAARSIADTVFVVLLPHELSWSGIFKVAGCVAAAGLVIGLAVLGRPQAPKGSARGFLLQWVLSLVIFATVFKLVGVPLEPLKYLIVTAPSTLLSGLLFVASLTRREASGAAIAFIAFAVFTLGQLWMDYHPPLSKPGDWQRVAAAISADDRETPVTVFPAELAEPLRWYLPAPIVAIPKPMSFTIDYVQSMALTDDAQVSSALDPIRARAQRLWIVTTDDCRQPRIDYYNYECHFLEEYLSRRYRLVRGVAFRGALARHYVRSSEGRADSSGKRYAN